MSSSFGAFPVSAAVQLQRGQPHRDRAGRRRIGFRQPRTGGRGPDPQPPDGQAKGKTFELYATSGEETTDWNGLFGTAVPDAVGALDGVRDKNNLPLDGELALVREDLRL